MKYENVCVSVCVCLCVCVVCVSVCVCSKVFFFQRIETYFIFFHFSKIKKNIKFIRNHHKQVIKLLCIIFLFLETPPPPHVLLPTV